MSDTVPATAPPPPPIDTAAALPAAATTTTTTTVSVVPAEGAAATPGSQPVHVQTTATTTASAPGAVADAVNTALERQVALLQKVAAIPFFAALKALFVLAVIAAGVVIYERRADLINSVIEQVKEQEGRVHENALREEVSRHKTIRAVLDNTREDLGASRALLFQFHNGQTSLQGLPFLYQSETSESLAPGVSNEAFRMQKLPISLTVDWLPSFLDGECIEQAAANANTSLRSALGQVGSVAVFACPVFIPGSAEPAGYVAASYLQGWQPPDFERARARMKHSANIIGTTLELYARKSN